MINKYRLRAIIDIDDVLMPCGQLAIERANKEYNFNPPLKLEEISGWGKTGKRTDVIIEYYKDPEFYKNQTLYPGAKEFIEELSKLVEIFFVTAVGPEIMSIRATMLRELFPMIHPNHIIMSSRKDVVNADIILDDNPNHILDSNAPYPVLMRRPWNHYLTGLLAVNTYDEFLWLIKEIINSYAYGEVLNMPPRIIALVGPSGSGKNEIADKLQKEEGLVRPKSYTTKRPKNEDERSRYNFISKAKFIEMKNKGLFFETSVYAGSYFGTMLSDIENHLKTNRKIVLPIDIAGAIALKSKFSDCVTIYMKKDKRNIISNILKEPYTDEEKANRLISLTAEYRNKNMCNYIICNNSINDAILKIKEILTNTKEE